MYDYTNSPKIQKPEMKKSCMITHLMGILMITSIFTSCKNADVNKGERQVDSCMVTEEKKRTQQISMLNENH